MEGHHWADSVKIMSASGNEDKIKIEMIPGLSSIMLLGVFFGI